MGVPNKLIRKLLCRRKSAKSQPLKENQNPQPSSEDTLDIWDQQRDQPFELNDDDNIFEIQLNHDSTTPHQEEVIIDAGDMGSQQALLLTPSDSDAETDIIMELKDMKVIYPVSDSDAEPEPEPEPDTIDIKDIIVFHQQPNSDSDSDADVTDSKADVVVKFEPEINPDDTPRSTSLRMLIRQSLREERSAVRIQAAFRAFLARRTLRGLKGLVRIQALMRGHGVRKRGAATFRSTLALVRVQARVRARRVRIAFECQMDQWRKLQKQQRGSLLDRVSKETEGGWCDSIGSFEDMQSKLMKRKEAAVKRERSRAYALARQWQARPRQHVQAHASAAAVQHRDFKPDRSNWAWDWMEKWSRVRSWERQRFLDFDLKDGIKIIRKRNNEEDSLVSKTRKIKKLAATSNSNHKKVTVPVSRLITIPPHDKKPNSPIDAKSSDRSRSRSNPKERLTSDKDGKKRLSLPGHGLDHHRTQQTTKQVVPRTIVNKRIIPAAPKPVKVNKGHELKPTRLGLYAVESIH